jgi:hypothetical protein
MRKVVKKVTVEVTNGYLGNGTYIADKVADLLPNIETGLSLLGTIVWGEKNTAYALPLTGGAWSVRRVGTDCASAQVFSEHAAREYIQFLEGIDD